MMIADGVGRNTFFLHGDTTTYVHLIIGKMMIGKLDSNVPDSPTKNSKTIMWEAQSQTSPNLSKLGDGKHPTNKTGWWFEPL